MRLTDNRYIRFRIIWFISFFIFTSCGGHTPSAAQNLISVNTKGYIPNSPKLAFTTIHVQPADSFKLVEAATLETVYKGEIRIAQFENPIFGDRVHELNFSSLQKPGTYRLFIPELGIRSVEFNISDGVYDSAVNKAIESFYYQRCGTKVDIGTKWRHTVCHQQDAVAYSNPQKRMDVTGGWHDAGDYGKYSVNTAVSLAFLLYLYDHHPGKFHDGQLNIPEQANNIPDLLDEARWALTWLMRMQDENGGVHHKVQKKKWTGEYLPQNDPDTRYVFELSSTATADFAAVSALAARLFQSFDPAFSDSLARAATHAWDFLERHPGVLPDGGFTNPADVQGGEYGDSNDSDERLWASVELYRLTGQQEYHRYFLENYIALGGPKAPPISWKNVGNFAYYSYIRQPGGQQEPEARTYITKKVNGYADRLVKRIPDNGYRVVLKENEYYWGSNSVVMGYAFDLIQAYEITGMKLFREAALDQLHYIMGRNPFGLSYVTGVGSKAVQDPYHQFSIKLNTDDPVPGMVVGGPNNHNHLDGKALSKYPGKSYEDDNSNYMVNETAINYTAPFVYLAGYFSDMQDRSVTSTSTN